MLTRKRETDILKMTENCQKSHTKQQNLAVFSRISNANVSSWSLSERSLETLPCIVLLVDIASVVRELLKKTAPKSRYIGFCALGVGAVMY